MSGPTETINKIFKLVHKNIRYDHDRVVFKKEEFWKSWAQEIKEGATNIRDDCDGYALTFAELLVENGISPEHIAITFCILQGEGHLVCEVFDMEQQEWFILDNNVARPEPKHKYQSLGVKWISCMYLNNPGVWVHNS